MRFVFSWKWVVTLAMRLTLNYRNHVSTGVNGFFVHRFQAADCKSTPGSLVFWVWNTSLFISQKLYSLLVYITKATCRAGWRDECGVMWRTLVCRSAALQTASCEVTACWNTVCTEATLVICWKWLNDIVERYANFIYCTERRFTVISEHLHLILYLIYRNRNSMSVPNKSEIWSH